MLKLALVGVGRWGSNIRHTLDGLRGVRLTHICAASPQELVPLPGHYQTTTDYRDIVAASDELDGVIIATPGSTHATIALPFLQKKIPVFIEKPLATTVADARRLHRVATTHKTILFVGHIHRYNPAFLKVTELLPNIGPLRTIHFTGTNWGPVRDDMSVLWDWGPHPVSLALSLAGTLPRTVQAWGLPTLRPTTTLYDTVFMQVKFPRNLTATAHLSWLAPLKETKLTVVGRTGSMLLDDRAEKKVVLTRSRSTAIPAAVYPPVRTTPPLTVELRTFIHCLEQKQKPLTDSREGVAVVTILAAAERSMAARGKPVAIRSSAAMLT